MLCFYLIEMLNLILKYLLYKLYIIFISRNIYVL